MNIHHSPERSRQCCHGPQLTPSMDVMVSGAGVPCLHASFTDIELGDGS